MPEVAIEIAGRAFTVSCGEGEEPQLRKAAALLDGEAGAVGAAAARLTDTRLLLMSGLMLADRMLDLAVRLETAEAKLGAAEARAADIARDALELQNGQADAQSAQAAMLRMTERIEALAGERD